MPPVPVPNPVSTAYATDAVNRFFLDGTDLFCLGTFSRFALSPGSAALVDSTTGVLSAPIWNVQDEVLNAVPDGSGGWYIQGGFVYVQGVARRNLAHVLSDGSLDSWNPAANGSVDSMASDGTNIYVGGFFTNISSTARTHLAAFDIATGTLQSWTPTADGSVDHMWANSGSIYLSGSFTHISSTSRNHVASVLTSDGSVTAFDPAVDGGPVNAMAFMSGIVFLGGNFSLVGGTARVRIAQVASVDGTLNSWYPTGGANDQINSLFVDIPNSKLYVGGAFTLIGGSTRNRLAVLDTATAAVGSFDPDVTVTAGSCFVNTIDLHSGILYFGGTFQDVRTSSSGFSPSVARNNVASWDIGSDSLTSWNPDSETQVNFLLFSSPNVFVGAEFTLFNGTHFGNIALLDSLTGLPQSWSPVDVSNTFPLNAQIHASDVSGGIIYFGGFFTGVSSSTRLDIAAINRSDGTLNAWYPAGGSNDEVHAIAVGPDGNIYVGGLFTSIGGQSRNRLASIDSSGTVTTWNPGFAGGTVSCFVFDGNTLYVGGANNIRAYDIITGLQISTFGDPTAGVQADSSITSMVLVGSTLYFGGNFSTITQSLTPFTRNQFAAVDKSTGLLTSWNPSYDPPSGIDTINVMVYWNNGSLYAGGDFQLIKFLPRPGFAIYPSNQLPDPPVIFFGATRTDDETTVHPPTIGGLDPTTGTQVWTSALNIKDVTFPHSPEFVEVFALAAPAPATTPSITLQPIDQEVCSGATATFIAAASGDPSPTVQWQLSTDSGSTWNDIIGETSTTLSFTTFPSDNGNEYRAVFTNTGGTATTTAAILTVDAAPAITTQPVDQSVISGAHATFTAAASGSPAPTVQWQVSTDGGSTWNNIIGAISTTLDFITSSGDNGKKYRAIFTNLCGTATTDAATLSVATAPVITTNPINLSICLSPELGYWAPSYWASRYWAPSYWSTAVVLVGTATFTATASGTPAPTVQWQISTNGGSTWADISGATSTTLSIPVFLSDNGNEYRAVFTNTVGTATTAAAILTTDSVAPTVTLQPTDQTVIPGAHAIFTAAASGSTTPTVQWQVSTDSGSTWSNLIGETSTTLDFIALLSENENQYRAVFTNSCGSATTDAALLIVVTTALAITLNPIDQSVCTGDTATFTAAAVGDPPITVQWEVSTDSGSTWNDLVGEISTTLSIVTSLPLSGNEYRAVFTNPSGSAITTAATLIVNVPPVVTLNPIDLTVDSFTTATFTATASGIPTPTIQWQVSTDSGSHWTNLPGATHNPLAFVASFSQNGNEYRAVFTNVCGIATTSAAILTVNNVAPPLSGCGFSDDLEEAHFLCIEV